MNHQQHIPMAGEEARGDVLGEGDLGLAVDGDVIVVVDPEQILEIDQDIAALEMRQNISNERLTGRSGRRRWCPSIARAVAAIFLTSAS
jgi:hypothetical protein